MNNNNNKNNNNYVRGVSELPFYMILLEDIFSAYFDCRKNKRKTKSAVLFEIDYEANLVKLCREINDRTYEIGRSIAFVVTKPKLREVFAADFRDRIVHHLVIRKLEPLFEEYFIEDSYNCRKGKGCLYGINRLHEKIRQQSEDYTKDCWIGKFDISGFFMAIDKTILWQKLERFISDRYHEHDRDDILWLTEKIVLHCPEKNCIRQGNLKLWEHLPKNKSLFGTGDNFGLPIGNLSSQTFANFYLAEFDRMNDGKFAYGRYVDDFYLVGDKKAILKHIPVMRNELKMLGLTLHPRKVYLQHYTKGVSFIGAYSKMDRLYAGKRIIHNFGRTIRGLKCTRDNAETFVQSVNSYLGYLIHFKSYNIRRRILEDMPQEWYGYAKINAGHNKLNLIKTML